MNSEQQARAQDSPTSSLKDNGQSKVERRRAPLVWVMFPALFLLYLLLPTKNYFWDGVSFAQSIEDATRLSPALFHPNHLIYNPFGYLFYKAFRGVGLNLRALEVLQIANAFLSVLSAYLFFRILRRTLGSVYWTVTLCLLFALSATWWKYSTDADSYIPSVLFLILSFYFLMPDRKPRAVVAALLYSVAMLFHQMAVFFFPVLLVGIYLQARRLDARRRMMLVAVGGMVSFLFTIVTYFYSFYLQTGRTDLRTFYLWTTSLSPEPGHAFNAWGNFVYTFNGHVKLFTSGRLTYLKDALDFWTVAALVILLLLIAALIVQMVRNFSELKAFFFTVTRKDERFQDLRKLCLVWIASFFIFQYFFIPQHTYYRLFYLPALILWLSTYLVQYEAQPQSKRRYRAALLVGAIAVSNLVFYITPLTQARNYPPVAMALKLNQAWPPGTVVYLASINSDNSLVRYFNPSAVLIEVSPQTLEREVRNLPPGTQSVWMETSLIDIYEATPEGRSWLEAHTARDPEYEFVNDKYRLQFYRLKPETFTTTAAPESK